MHCESSRISTVIAVFSHVQQGIMNAEDIAAHIKKAVAEALNEANASNKRKHDDEIAEVVSKKIKEAEVPDFKRSYNKEQFKHNMKVNESIKNAAELLEEGKTEKAKDKLEEGMNLIKKRQKLIKIADREEHGWEVAKCYKSDNLATDSEDEKRLSRSRRQAAANKKRQNVRKKLLST